jgi:undecaprenyl-diphosphatase
MEQIVDIDKKLFVFLNGLGSEPFDSTWLLITSQFNWTPLFIALLFLIYKNIGIKKTLFVLLFVAILITVCNELTDLVKNYFQRTRPCNDEEIFHLIRIVKDSETYSFFSGHAANSMAAMVFVISLLKRYYRYTFLLLLYPLIFAYSRIYLGLHFPSDIITGYAFGATLGILFFKLYLLFEKRIEKNKLPL